MSEKSLKWRLMLQLDPISAATYLVNSLEGQMEWFQHLM